MNATLRFFLGAVACFALSCADVGSEPDDVKAPDYGQYVVYEPGDLPLILSVPHGGSLFPVGFRARTCPGSVSVMDANTIELARAIRDAFVEVGATPHIVINPLRRSIVDPNRSLAEGTCENEAAMGVWRAYHATLDSLRDAVEERYGMGLVVDVHGHSNPISRIEWGYLLSERDLALPDSVLDRPEWALRSSVRARALRDGDQPFSALLRGPRALGSLLQEAGFPGVPSRSDPVPDEHYFSGGFITAKHGSQAGGKVDAVQMECNFVGLRDSPENRRTFALAFRDAVLSVLSEGYTP